MYWSPEWQSWGRGVDLLKNLELQIQAFRGRLYHQVGIGHSTVHFRGCREAGKRRRFVICRDALLGHQPVQIALNGRLGRFKAAALTSIKDTWWPDCAKTWAMPLPMVPAPMTATLWLETLILPTPLCPRPRQPLLAPTLPQALPRCSYRPLQRQPRYGASSAAAKGNTTSCSARLYHVHSFFKSLWYTRS